MELLNPQLSPTKYYLEKKIGIDFDKYAVQKKNLDDHRVKLLRAPILHSFCQNVFCRLYIKNGKICKAFSVLMNW